jgi:hypothetical protein
MGQPSRAAVPGGAGGHSGAGSARGPRLPSLSFEVACTRAIDAAGCGSTEVIEMAKNLSVVLYVAALIAVVVIVDVLFFRQRFWERLMVNSGIVLVFAAFYFRFLKNH